MVDRVMLTLIMCEVTGISMRSILTLSDVLSVIFSNVMDVFRRQKTKKREAVIHAVLL